MRLGWDVQKAVEVSNQKRFHFWVRAFHWARPELGTFAEMIQKDGRRGLSFSRSSTRCCGFNRWHLPKEPSDDPRTRRKLPPRGANAAHVKLTELDRASGASERRASRVRQDD